MFHELAYMHSYQPEDWKKENEDVPILTHSRSQPLFRDKTTRESIHPKSVTRQRSLVVGQKLRESKWFTHDEIKILCAVLESGFVLQKRCNSDENHRGIALWAPGYEKSKDPDYITIHTVCMQNGIYKYQTCTLLSFWASGTQIKINNLSDQTNEPNNEEVIRNQISYAQINKHKWHNSEHFTYWCRYGAAAKSQKPRMVSDSFKWGHFGLNAGFLMLRSRKRTKTTSN